MKDNNGNNVELRILYSEDGFLSQKKDAMPFNEGNCLLKMLDRYYPLEIGYDKTAYQILINGEVRYSGRFDVGDGNCFKEHKGNYGIVEEIEMFLTIRLNNYERELKNKDKTNIEKENLINVISDYKNLINEFLPIIKEASEINKEKAMEFNEEGYRKNCAIIKDYVERKGEDWAKKEEERLSEIYSRYMNEYTMSEDIDKKEIKNMLLKYCVNENGDLVLSGLDFTDFPGDIFICNWKTHNNISQSEHQAKKIWQGRHKAEEVNQGRHKATCIFQSEHKADIVVQINHTAGYIKQGGYNNTNIINLENKK